LNLIANRIVLVEAGKKGAVARKCKKSGGSSGTDLGETFDQGRPRLQQAAGNGDYDDYDEGLPISFFRHFAQGEEPPDTGGGRFFSFDATLGLLATRWRLWRRGDS